MTSPYGKGPKGKATELHAKIVRARGECEHCGARDVRLECAHIIGRRYSQTRTDTDNAFCLCHVCHQLFTDYPPRFRDFIYEKIGEDEYWRLDVKSASTAKVDWPAEVERLRALLNEVNA